MENKKPPLLRRILHWLGRTISWTRVIVINGLFVLLLLFVITSLFQAAPPPIPDQAPLRLQVSGYLVDQRAAINVQALLLGANNQPAQTLVRDLVRSIDNAAEDPRITELVLELEYFLGGGISKLEEVGQALARFKESGKPIYAYSDIYSQSQYYLASYADTIYMHPLGGVMLTGFGGYRNYYKDALDKLGVNTHVFRVGDYKDAVEPYIRNDMSDASREHNSQWINQLWGVYTSRVENQRQLPKGAIDDYINNMAEHLRSENGDAGQLAVSQRLVDELMTQREKREQLIERHGEAREGDTYLAVDYQHYLYHLDRLPEPGDERVGVIVASGTIFDGEQAPGNIGSETLSQLLHQAREKDNIKALVLRIDSGGGSAFASEVIRQEILATQNAGIPVVISMGSVAASGGYWIAANADEIWATPTTLTGSIGVFSVIPTFEETLDKIGVHSDGIGTTELADSLQLDRPMSPAAADVMQQQVDSIYNRFIQLVANGRGTHPDLIHPIAQGRVWSGTRAQNFGLVDELGYLEDAIVAAAQLAELDNYGVDIIELPGDPLQQIVASLISTSQPLLSRLGIGESTTHSINTWQAMSRSPQWAELNELLRLLRHNPGPHGIYARCIACVETF